MVTDEASGRARHPLLDRGGGARMAADCAVALTARPIEDDLARGFESIEHRIGIGQGAGAGRHRVGEQLDAWRRELRALKGSEVVEEARGRVDGGRRVVPQGGERLVLQRVDAAVELVAAAPVRAAVGGRPHAVRAGDPDIENRGDRAPDVGDGLARRACRCRARNGRRAVEQLDVRGQGDRDPDQAVLRQVGEVMRTCAVDTEVVGIDRAKEWIVDTRRGHLRQPGLCRCRRELEVLGVHVAVGTRPPIATQTGQSPIVEVRLAPAHGGVHGRDRRGGAAVSVQSGGRRRVIASAARGKRDASQESDCCHRRVRGVHRLHGNSLWLANHGCSGLARRGGSTAGTVWPDRMTIVGGRAAQVFGIALSVLKQRRFVRRCELACSAADDELHAPRGHEQKLRMASMGRSGDCTCRRGLGWRRFG